MIFYLKKTKVLLPIQYIIYCDQIFGVKSKAELRALERLCNIRVSNIFDPLLLHVKTLGDF